MFLASMTLGIASCAEVEEENEYVNWRERNVAYIDSIAKVCDKNADGRWTKMVSYTLNDSVESLNPNNIHYIYIHKLEDGNGTTHPLYKDSVRCHYLGRLIPSKSYPKTATNEGGYIFDKSYSTYTANEETDVPTLFGVNGFAVSGFATATLHMVEGDKWRVYIPYYLAYGESDNTTSGIPGYSTLIFDIKLAKIYRFGIDTNTNWY